MRDTARGPELVPPDVIVYGRNPVREALRGRRRVLRAWASRELDGSRRGEVERDDAELERALRLARPPGDLRGGRALSLRGPDALLAADDALVVALDEVQDPHNLGAVCRVAEAAGAAGVVIPERRAAEVTPAVCKASAGAVEHLPVARVRNLADWLGDAKEAGAWVYGAAADAGSPTTSPTTAAGSCSCSGSEGQGPAAARGGGLRRSSSSLPHARQGRVAQRVHRGGRARVRDLAIRRERP